MEMGFFAALATVIAGGLCSGSFSIPFKHNKTWAWENNWLIWSVTALLVVPWAVAFLSVPDLPGVYTAQRSCLIFVILFGLVWGVGSITFGKGLDLLGVTLAMPLMLGLNNCIGTLVPIMMNDPKELLSPEGRHIILGIAVIVAGLIVYSIAGKHKETTGERSRSKFVKGLLVCLVAGIFGPMVNIAFVYGDPIAQEAISHGAGSFPASNAIWAVALSSGFFVNAAYCLYLFRKRGTSARYAEGGAGNYLFAVIAGVIWFLSILLYGVGSRAMGPLGTSVGWATMQTVAILTGNIAGLLSGEWKGCSRRSLTLMFLGLALMFFGIIVIAS